MTICFTHLKSSLIFDGPETEYDSEYGSKHEWSKDKSPRKSARAALNTNTDQYLKQYQ